MRADQDSSLGWIDGVAILVAVVVIANVSAFNDWRKDRQFRAMQSHVNAEQQATVLRDAEVTHVLLTDLLVGDVLLVRCSFTKLSFSGGRQ